MAKQGKKEYGTLAVRKLFVGDTDATPALEGITATAGELNDFGNAVVTTNELDSIHIVPTQINWSVGTQAGSSITASAQFRDADNQDIPYSVGFTWYLSEDEIGIDIADTGPSGGIAEGANGQINTSTLVQGIGVSSGSGLFDLTVTEAGTKPYYLVIILPFGKISVSPVMNFTV